MQTLRMDNFSAGMNNYVSAKHVGKAAQLLRDANSSPGSLRPESAPLELGTYELSALNHYGWTNRSVTKWYDKYYWSFNDAEAAPYYGGELGYLGVDPYGSLLPLAEATPTGTGLSGTYNYCITLLTAEGWESAPGQMEDKWWSSINVTNKAIAITLPDAGDLDAIISAVRVYRTGTEGSDYYMIGEYTLAELGGSITDELSDLDLFFNLSLETANYLPPPDGGKFLTESDGTFYLAVGDRLYISKQSNLHAWNPLNWISGFGGDITGIRKEFNGILVFTANGLLEY